MAVSSAAWLFLLTVVGPAIAGAADGRLFVVQRLSDTSAYGAGLDGNFGVAVSPDGANVYVAARNDRAVSVFARDAITGLLTIVQVLRDGVGGVDGLDGATAVRVSPDAANVYVISRAAGALAVFQRSLSDGSLTFLEVHRDGVGGVAGLNGAVALAMSPDGLHVYTAARDADALAAFSRNPATGALTFVAAYVDGVGGFSGLRAANDVAVSPDGLHVYAVSRTDGAVTAYTRDPLTGALSPVQVVVDGVGGASGLAVASGVACSPDGAHVYVAASALGGSVVVFARDATTGALTFIERQTNGAAAVDGLGETYAIAVSPDGRHVYATARADRSIVGFSRDSVTGALQFLERVGESESRTLLKDPVGLALSPDGRFVHAVSYTGADVVFTVLSRDVCGDGAQTDGEDCDDGSTVDGDGCSAACRFELCPPSPNPSCIAPRSPHASRLRVMNQPIDRRDRIVWSWRGATAPADFGDPLAAADYQFCLYDALGAPQPLTTPSAPHGDGCFDDPCWDVRSSGFRYRDGLRSPSGVHKMSLRSDASLNGRITLKANGRLTQPPALPLTPPVTAQLYNGATGVCWQAVYSTSQRSDAVTFQAVSD